MAQREDDLQLDQLVNFPEVIELENRLDDSEDEEKPTLFKEYALALLELWRRGFLNTQTVAYYIASKKLIPRLKDIEEIDSLLWEAGVLELPYEEAYGSQEEYMYEWRGFVERIETLGSDELENDE